MEQKERSRTHAESKVLHHTSYATHLLHGLLRTFPAFFEQILYTTVGVDLHSTEIGEAIDEPGLFPKFLAEGIAKVVRRISRDQEDRLSHFRQLDRKGARGCSFADTAFTADEDPSKRFLQDN